MLICLSTILPVTAQAFEKHGYVNVDASNVVIVPNDSNVHVNSSALRILLGKAINRFMQAEGVFAFGAGEGMFSETNSGQDEFLGAYNADFNMAVKLKSMFGVNVRINALVTNWINLYSKFGFVSVNLKETVAGTGTLAGGDFGNVSGGFSETYTKGGAGLEYGVGLDVEFSDRHALGMELMVLPTVKGNYKEYRLASFSLGYIFSFK